MLIMITDLMDTISQLCEHLMALAQDFSKYYAKHRILNVLFLSSFPLIKRTTTTTDLILF